MNVVVITTDAVTQSMVGAYGSAADTPNIDRLAEDGMRFDRAYNTTPTCTPARGSIQTGLHPQINGAWANNIAPHRDAPMLGEIFREQGYRTAHTGKWHLSGTGYFGTGEADGGYDPDWWYDGARYAEDIGESMFEAYWTARTPEDLRESGFSEDTIWGHRVADRAVDFLETVGDEPFLLSVDFDEPHGPSVAPLAYWENVSVDDIPKPDTFEASLDDKPQLQQRHREESPIGDWEDYLDPDGMGLLLRRWACHEYIDREIGRIIDAVDRLHAADTAIVYTSDHGAMMGAHGIRATKGPMMYEEICNVPFLLRTPECRAGVVSDALVSHLDILPTMLDLAGLHRPDRLHGESLRPLLQGDRETVRDTLMLNYHRFAINHDGFGGFYPIRCLVDDRYKLAINLFDTDEFYDHEADPAERTNRIDDPDYATARERLHEQLLDRMDAIRDPFRSYRWGDRPWNSIREQSFENRNSRGLPETFDFQPDPYGLG
jgi:uncharacterized sulfatase